MKILGGLADENAVHDDVFTGREILGEELMFGRDIGEEKVGLPGGFHEFAFGQIGEGDEDVVAGVEAENSFFGRVAGWHVEPVCLAACGLGVCICGQEKVYNT